MNRIGDGLTESGIGGGQLWRQTNLPCCEYIVISCPGGFVLISNIVNEVGGTTKVLKDGKFIFTEQELYDLFVKHNFSYLGQISELVQDHIL